MPNNYSNTAQETALAGAISGVTTSITVQATTGFPVSFPYTLAIDAGQANEELVSVTAASGTILTVTRGYDSTSAVSHEAGAQVRHVHCAADFRDSREHEAASTAVHGVSGSVVGTTDTQVLTNKNLTSGTNTFPGTLATTASLTAHTGATSGVHGATGSVVGTTDTQTLTNKTLALGSNTVSGTTAQFNTALSDGDFATLAGTETLTNKTVNLASNTLTGTKAQFNTALSDADFATLAGTETLTNKNLGSATNTFPAFALAHTTDAKMCWGAFSATISAGSNTKSGSVSLPASFFGSAPVVMVNINSGDGAVARWSSRAYDITSSSFTYLLFAPDASFSGPGATVQVQWMAMGIA